MADQTELRMNLAAVKRVDPYAKQILDSSAHVAFYTFNSEENEWEKTDVEGAFFIYTRNAEPYHSIFINNRLNTNSLVEPITGQIELQSQPPFLLYRNERSRIRGFWFYNSAECDRIGELVGKIVKDCEPNLKQMEPSSAVTVGVANVDIFSMLSKAQEDFNNSLATNNSINQTQQPQQLQQKNSETKNMPAPTTDVTSQSVMNFFAAAKPTATEVPLFQRLLSNSMHVDQLEKQQLITPQECGDGGGVSSSGKPSPSHIKSSTPQKINKKLQNVVKTTAATTPVTVVTAKQSGTTNLENGLSLMRIQSPNHGQQELGTSPLATFLNTNNLQFPKVSGRSGMGLTNPQLTATNATDVSDLESRQKPIGLHQLIKKSNEISVPSGALSVIALTPGKPALMPPTMFLSSSGKCGSVVSKSGSCNSGTIQSSMTDNNLQHQQLPQHSKTSAINVANTKSSSLHQEFDCNQLEPLTQSQLLQAMQYLIKNDADFIKKLHEAYLKSFTEMVSL